MKQKKRIAAVCILTGACLLLASCQMPARKPEQTSDTRPTQASESSALTESSAEPAETTTERSDPVSEPPLTTSEPETTAEPPVTTIDLYAMEWTPPEQANADVPLNIRTYDGFDQPCHHVHRRALRRHN